jgi:DNA-binding PadR family transcriptional regulator
MNMGLRLRISPQTLSLLEALLLRPAQWHHGYALSQHTGIASGTLYPILMRLEEPGKTGRPPRHLYRLTSDARVWAREELLRARARKVWKPAYSGA